MKSVARIASFQLLLTCCVCLAEPAPAPATSTENGAATTPVAPPAPAAIPARKTNGPQPTAYTHKASFGKPLPAPDRPAQPMLKRPPQYPKKWKAWGQPAYAIITVLVNQYGKTEEAQCIEATDRAFAREAEQATEAWFFMPALKNQQAVRSLLTMRFNFDSPTSFSGEVVATPAPVR